ncbi:coagulation factor VII isoform X1 [Bombyx mori]|uniref:Peptidase S1 domain-containing protein n=1 Tax=Bombyx mori TaxID=7091 RepID=A0A8R2DPP1_BOMMO|nr:coagulation factor VII isoform X1 [Bombyx mori]
MFRQNKWKVILLVAASVAAAESSRAVAVYQKPYKNVMFISKNIYRRRGRQRVMFLDDRQNGHFGNGEIDLTTGQNSKIKFDDNTDYEFTSDGSDVKAEPSGHERYYEPRFRTPSQPLYQQRFGPYAPGFSFEPFPPVNFAPAVRNGYYSGWRARSPRVVFPYASDSVTVTNSHAGPGVDNVVFRDQNFGLSDVGVYEQALQDLGAGSAETFPDKDANVPHRARNKADQKLRKPMFVQTEGVRKSDDNSLFPNISKRNIVLPEFKPITDEQMERINEILNVPVQSKRKAKELPVTADRRDENCPQGGSCEFFFYCWMVGGLLDGTCGGLLKGCCHRVAKAGVLGVQDSNSIEYPNEGFSYGPVVNDERCGIATNKQTAQRRIVGGDDAGFGTFPWQAYIRIGSSRCNMLMSIFELIGWKQCWIERCGGSLISRRHVVTAGHCVARAQPRHVRVTLGDYVINSASEPFPAYTFGVRAIKVHPLFKFTPQADRFDVAVLTLDRNVQYMPHISPICLPERGSDFLGQYGWAAGWGALSPGSRLRPRTLQAVDVPVLDNRVCERWHRANGINVVIYPEMLCAGYRGGGKDSCQGDSGGPLMLERGGRWYLIGVVSAGYSCASRGQPGIYHRVAHTVDWISHATTLS